MDLLTMRANINSGKHIFDMPLRVAYYARVSTDKAEQLNSLDNQAFYFEDYIKKNDNWKFVGAYIDEGLSGTSTTKRTGFLKMIREAKEGKFDLIVTKEISRFARDTLDSIQYTRELLTHGVGVYFQSDNINTLLPDAELRLTIMASIAQDEVRKLSERLRFGYKRSIERGRVLGQNNILGYDKADGILTINEDEAKIVCRIFEIYNEGRMGIRRIAGELEKEGMVSPQTGKMISPDTIKNVINNPKYKGYYCSGKTTSIDHINNKRIRLPQEEWNVYKDPNIPAIVSEETWDKANRLYQARSALTKENGQAYQARYSFSGKLFCGEHGTTYHRHIYKSKKKGEQEVWNCKLYRQKGKDEGCNSPTIYSKELHEILGKIYKSVYDEKDKVIEGLMGIYSSIDSKDYSKDIAKLEKEIDKQKAKKELLLDLLAEKQITKAEFAERNNAMNEEIEKLTNETSEYQIEIQNALSNECNMAALKKTLELEFDNENSFNSEISNVLLNKIIVHKVGGDKTHLHLEIILNIGKSYIAEYNKKSFLSLQEIGISQAQVSRLEKSALKNMKKYIG